jgi:hypothetical protein
MWGAGVSCLCDRGPGVMGVVPVWWGWGSGTVSITPVHWGVRSVGIVPVQWEGIMPMHWKVGPMGVVSMHWEMGPVGIAPVYWEVGPVGTLSCPCSRRHTCPIWGYKVVVAVHGQGGAHSWWRWSMRLCWAVVAGERGGLRGGCAHLCAGDHHASQSVV